MYGLGTSLPISKCALAFLTSRPSNLLRSSGRDSLSTFLHSILDMLILETSLLVGEKWLNFAAKCEVPIEVLLDSRQLSLTQL
jgi:hypothetical protein